MATGLQKLFFTLLAGAAITAGKCNTEAEEPTQPPPDAEAEVQPALPIEEVPPDEAVALYGVPYEPPEEPPDQPMYGVPMD